MRSKTLKKPAIVFILVLAGFIVLYAFPAEADKSQVEYKASLTVPANNYQFATATVFIPPSPQSVLYTASFDVSSGETVKFYPFDIALYELWQEGKFEPTWVTGSRGEFGMSISSGAPSGENRDFNLLVLNENSSPLNVDVAMARTWHESSKLGLVSGSALVSLGIGVMPLLMFGKSKLHLKYSATIFAMAFTMVFFVAWAPYWSTPPDPVLNVTQALPGVLFFEAFPLIALLYLLEKNNGFAYFKSWNMKQPLRISGMLLFSGYTFPIFFMLVGMFNAILRPMPLDPYKLTAYSLIVSGFLMATGLVIFIGLWASHHRRNLST